MSEAISMSLLAGYKFMLEIHLRQCRFVFSACGPFIKNKERIQKFKETETAWFQHDMAYGDFKDLLWRTAFGNVVHYKIFTIAKNPKYY